MVILGHGRVEGIRGRDFLEKTQQQARSTVRTRLGVNSPAGTGGGSGDFRFSRLFRKNAGIPEVGGRWRKTPKRRESEQNRQKKEMIDSNIKERRRGKKKEHKEEKRNDRGRYRKKKRKGRGRKGGIEEGRRRRGGKEKMKKKRRREEEATGKERTTTPTHISSPIARRHIPEMRT